MYLRPSLLYVNRKMIFNVEIIQACKVNIVIEMMNSWGHHIKMNGLKIKT